MKFREKNYDDFTLDITPVDRVVAKTSLVGVGDYICPVDHPQFRGGGPVPCPYIIFSRGTVKLLPNRGPSAVCGPATVNLLDVGDSYTRTNVDDDGARWDWIAVSPELLRDIAQELSPEMADCPTVFHRSVVPISMRVFLAQRRFFTVASQATIETLALEEAALNLVAETVLDANGAARKLPNRGPRRNGARRYEIVEATKCLLARHYAANLSLVEIAQAVHCSPAYLSRTFTRLAGCSLHQYRQRLRLAASLELLADCRSGGAAVASQLGFASHSHFTSVFHRAFGLTPKEFTRSTSKVALFELKS